MRKVLCGVVYDGAGLYCAYVVNRPDQSDLDDREGFTCAGCLFADDEAKRVMAEERSKGV